MYYAVTSCLLGFVQGGIHLLEKPRRGVGSIGIHPRLQADKPDADSHVQIDSLRNNKGAVLDVGTQPFGDGRPLGLRRARQQQHEFLATIARQHVAAAQVLSEDAAIWRSTRSPTW